MQCCPIVIVGFPYNFMLCKYELLCALRIKFIMAAALAAGGATPRIAKVPGHQACRFFASPTIMALLITPNVAMV